MAIKLSKNIKINNLEDVKQVLNKVKNAQGQFQALLKEKTWVEEASKYAEKQGKEVKKLLSADVAKVKVFLEKEKKELEKFQKQIPAEVDKLKKFVSAQRKEFEKLLVRIRNGKITATATRVKRSAKVVVGKKAAPKRKKPAASATSTSTSAN